MKIFCINQSAIKNTFQISSASKKVDQPPKSTLANKISFKGDSLYSQKDKTGKIFCNSILGYQSKKEDFFNTYINPLFDTKTLSGVSPSILICGPDESILEDFKNAFSKSADYMGLNCTNIEDADIYNQSFMKNLMIQLKANKKNYEQTGKRSVIFINNPEKFLGMNIEDAKSRTTLNPDSNDFSILDSNQNAEKIAVFKSLFDNCHLLPQNSSQGFSTTFVFKSTNPHLIHPDFRDGKMSKEYIDFAQSEDFPQILTGQLQNSESSVAKKISKEISQNKLAFYLLGLYVSPNQFTGAYSNEALKEINRKACAKITERPNSSVFILTLADIISKTPKDISAKEVAKYEKIKNSIRKNQDEYEKLTDLNNDGMLSDEEENQLTQITAYEKNLAKSLLKKRNEHLLTPDEKILLSKFIERYNNDFETKNPSFSPKIKSIPYGGKRLEYAPAKKADLYRGDSGNSNYILWAEPPTEETLVGVLDNLDSIKNQNEFKDAKYLQISDFNGIEKFPQMQATSKLDIDGKLIFQTDLP